MQNKLQELTEKLYQEGLSKGKEEGAQILSEARAEAQKTIADAKAEAQAIIEQANKEAEALKAKASSDVKMASEQALQATKKDIENVLVHALIAESTAKTLSSADVIMQMVKAVAENFNAQESVDLAVVLPQSLQAELEPWAKSELAKIAKGGVKADFSKKIAGGFTIGPADGSWFVSLTDETFKALIEEYLRPVTKKLLFGE